MNPTPVPSRDDISNLKQDTTIPKKRLEEKIPHKEEIAQLLSQIGEHKVRIEELKQKVVKLEGEKKEEKELSLKIAKQWERDFAKKKEECATLNKELEEARKRTEAQILDLIGQKNHELEGLKSEVYNTRLELNQKLSHLNDELKGLKEFKERRDEYLKQVNYWKRRCDELINIYGSRRGTEGDEKEFRKNVDMSIQSIIKDNKPDLSFQQEVLTEYQATNFRQECKIKKLKEKIVTLNDYITQETSSLTKESETTKCRLQAKINDLERQSQSLKEELIAKVKENRSLKALSQIILDQRSEIEEFLIGALDHVKEEVKKITMRERRKKLPEIWGKTRVEEKTQKNWNVLDFKACDWEEKEKILSLLFSKLNSGLLPSNWRDVSLEKNTDTVNRSFNAGYNRPRLPTREAQKTPIRGGL